MPAFRRLVCSLLAAILLAAVPPHADAWEGDVHYLLTWWLAVKAGFSDADADVVAAADLSRDLGWVQPATAAMPHALIEGDKSAAEDVRDKHFPYDGLLPAAPSARDVKPGSPAAWYPVKAAIDASDARDMREPLGQALHPLQDSWSHQGMPDTPLRPGKALHPDLSWSHPEKRGGWFSHNADLTLLHPQDTIDTAKATFEALTGFLGKHPRFKDPKRSAASWPSLLPAVRDFAAADSKERKSAWLQRYAPTAPRRARTEIAGLSIPGSSDLVREALLIVNDAGRAGITAPEVVVTRVLTFLQIWLEKQNIGEAAGFIDWNGIKQQFPDATKEPDVVRWGRKFMTMWLADDHGRVNRLGHGNMQDRGFADLPEEIGAADRKPMPLRTPPDGRPRMWRVGDGVMAGSGWATVLRFGNSPHDAVILILDDAQVPRIVRMFSIADH